MANGIQTANGKAFEYSCVEALRRALSGYGEIEIESSSQLDTAKSLYEAVDSKMKYALDKAADAAVRVVKRLEPQLWNPNNNEPLYLSIQAGHQLCMGNKGQIWIEYNPWNSPWREQSQIKRTWNH